MKRMSASAILGFLVIIATSTFALAGKGDNTAPASPGEKSAVHETTSYYQGTWVGTWAIGGNRYQDITIKIGSNNPDGTFNVEYSSGPYFGERVSAPYTVNCKGQEVGETFVFKFNSPNGGTVDITMTKHEGDRAKAKTQARNNALEAYLRRK